VSGDELANIQQEGLRITGWVGSNLHVEDAFDLEVDWGNDGFGVGIMGDEAEGATDKSKNKAGSKNNRKLKYMTQ